MVSGSGCVQLGMNSLQRTALDPDHVAIPKERARCSYGACIQIGPLDRHFYFDATDLGTSTNGRLRHQHLSPKSHRWGKNVDNGYFRDVLCEQISLSGGGNRI